MQEYMRNYQSKMQNAGHTEEDDDDDEEYDEDEEISGTGFKRQNPWINHVKKYAKKKGISYSKAMKDANCKSSYKK